MNRPGPPLRPHRVGFTEDEFNRIISNTAADWRSMPEIFNNIVGFAGDPTCKPTQYLHIVAMMYDQLDASKIPSKTAVSFAALKTAFIALFGLGTTLPIWLNQSNQRKINQHQLTKDLCAHWSDIRQWVLFLYDRVLVQEDLEIDMRCACKTAILEFLGLSCNSILETWSLKYIPTDRHIMKIIYGLWWIETRDPRFSSWDPAEDQMRESALFNWCLCMTKFKKACRGVDWEILLGVFEGDPELLASALLCHLDRERSRGEGLDLRCITWDLQVITMLSLRESIRLALMHRGMMTVACKVLALVVDREWNGDKRVSASRCMVNAALLIKAWVDAMDALPFLSQALECGLVASLLKCETLLALSESPSTDQDTIILLGETLTEYSVYRSILHQLALAVDSAIDQKLDTKLSKDGHLYKVWNRLKEMVDERRRLVRRDVSEGHVRTCQNDTGFLQCSATIQMGMFRRCAGCLHAYYCSPKCQRYDWKKGKHKQYCTRVQQRFIHTNGQMSAVHSKDLKFFDQVILAELRKNDESLRPQTLKFAIAQLNFIGGQVHGVLDANAKPFETECKCYLYAEARWKYMVEAVKKGKRRMVLVRASIPGGMARKLVLQAIPLSVVLEGVEGRRLRGQVAEKYQFNLIFTCCGGKAQDDSTIPKV